MPPLRRALIRRSALALAGAALAPLAIAAPAAAAALRGDGSAAPEISAPSRSKGGTTARIVAPVFARKRLDRPRRGRPLPVQTPWSGQPQIMLALGSATHEGRDWVKILLPNRPNGSTGWVPRARVVLARTPYWVRVRTGSRRVTVYRNGMRVRSFRAVVGAPGTPTPHGLGAIYERNRQPDPHGFVGPWILSLTLLSEQLRSFDGGPGRIGIHGRDGASLADPLGSAASHGCIRVHNADIRWMAHRVPAGTPVRVSG